MQDEAAFHTSLAKHCTSLLTNILLTHAAPTSGRRLNIISCISWFWNCHNHYSPSSSSSPWCHSPPTHINQPSFCSAGVWPAWAPLPYRKLLCSHKTQSHAQTKGIKRSPVYNVLVKLICDLEKSTKPFFYCYLSSKGFLASFIISTGTQLCVETCVTKETWSSCY